MEMETVSLSENNTLIKRMKEREREGERLLLSENGSNLFI
jgi:hypothetical protein